MDIPELPDQACEDCGKNHREQVLKNMSPEGLANCLENELKSALDELDFLNKKTAAIKSSIEKLRQP